MNTWKDVWITVIWRSPNECIPVIRADEVEIYRGSIHPTPSSAFDAARNCRQLLEFLGGKPAKEIAL